MSTKPLPHDPAILRAGVVDTEVLAPALWAFKAIGAVAAHLK